MKIQGVERRQERVVREKGASTINNEKPYDKSRREFFRASGALGLALASLPVVARAAA